LLFAEAAGCSGISGPFVPIPKSWSSKCDNVTGSLIERKALLFGEPYLTSISAPKKIFGSRERLFTTA
jgi:hypothetical protein